MYVTPKEASKHFSVSDQALRSWAKDGKIKFTVTEGGHRRYYIRTENTVRQPGERVVYARVSSKKQEGDLCRQVEFLQAKYPGCRVVSDIGSGINFKRKGFRAILEGLFRGAVQEVVVAKRDRFTRFGFDLFEWIFEQHGAQLLSDQADIETNENELADDLMAIVTVFSARYYGRRKYNVLKENQDLSS